MKASRPVSLAYFAAILALGSVAGALSIFRLLHDGAGYQWLILAYLTILTSAFTIAIPGVNSKFSVSDTFIFINTILFGTAAGVLTAALDGLAGSIRCRTTAHRIRTVPFNTAVLMISVYAGGEVFFRLLGHGPLSHDGRAGLFMLALPLLFSVSAYYLSNSVLVAAVLALEGRGNVIRIWSSGAASTFGITLAGGAAGAVIAYCMRSITPSGLLIVVFLMLSIYYAEKILLGEDAGSTAGETGSRLISMRPAYQRFHYFMVALGLGFIVLLLKDLLGAQINYYCLIVAVCAVVAGFITVKIPAFKIKFSLADVFVFTNIILFGPVVGGITAALDGLAGSMRCKSKAGRMEFTLFNMGAMALSAYLAGAVYFRVLGQAPVYGDPSANLTASFLPALMLAVTYYLLNSMGVAVIVALQAQQEVLRFWRENLSWGLTAQVACALGAVFVAGSMAALSPSSAVPVLVFLAVIYISFRAWNRGLTTVNY